MHLCVSKSFSVLLTPFFFVPTSDCDLKLLLPFHLPYLCRAGTTFHFVCAARVLSGFIWVSKNVSTLPLRRLSPREGR